MSAQAVEHEPTLTLREGMDRIFQTFAAMSEEDRADCWLYLKNPRQYLDVARRARAQAYPERPRLAAVK